VSGQLWWYLARATGLVAWVGAVGGVLVGLALASRIGGRQVPPSWLLALHRHLGGLTVVFVAAHVGAVVADSYAHFGAADVLLPFASGWRPGAVAWGVVAMWLLVAVEVTSLARRRLPPQLWRAIHLSSYAVAVASTAHMVAAGADATTPFVRWAPVVAVGLAVTFLTYRALRPGPVRAGAA
jgi:DMSO/TMAO reductase YedYZ heme-binding membrane subunit